MMYLLKVKNEYRNTWDYLTAYELVAGGIKYEASSDRTKAKRVGEIEYIELCKHIGVEELGGEHKIQKEDA